MSERDHARKDGARLQPNSGRGSHAKGDATMDTLTGKYLIDYKEYGKSYTVNNNVWAKICTDAMAVGRDFEPVLKLVIGGQTELAVLDWSWFIALSKKEY
jgi:hypothetical protein